MIFFLKIVVKLKIVPKLASKQKINLKVTLWANSHQNSPGRHVHLKFLFYGGWLLLNKVLLVIQKILDCSYFLQCFMSGICLFFYLFPSLILVPSRIHPQIFTFCPMKSHVALLFLSDFNWFFSEPQLCTEDSIWVKDNQKNKFLKAQR